MFPRKGPHKMSDPYKVLGVTRDATDDEIKKAYRAMSKKYHPDANINNPHKEKAEEMFKLVQEAYQQIIYERQHPYASSGSSYGTGGGSYSGGPGYSGGYSQGPGHNGQFYTNWDDFFNDFFTGAFTGQYQYNQNPSAGMSDYDRYMRAAASYINSRGSRLRYDRCRDGAEQLLLSEPRDAAQSRKRFLSGPAEAIYQAIRHRVVVHQAVPSQCFPQSLLRRTFPLLLNCSRSAANKSITLQDRIFHLRCSSGNRPGLYLFNLMYS